MSYLLNLAKQDLGAARDNLQRARQAAKHHDPSKEWGASGRTLAEIIAGYEAWEAKALEAVKAAKEAQE